MLTVYSLYRFSREEKKRELEKEQEKPKEAEVEAVVKVDSPQVQAFPTARYNVHSKKNNMKCGVTTNVLRIKTRRVKYAS